MPDDHRRPTTIPARNAPRAIETPNSAADPSAIAGEDDHGDQGGHLHSGDAERCCEGRCRWGGAEQPGKEHEDDDREQILSGRIHDGEGRQAPVSYTHLTLPTNREV